ncbi:MAG: glycoside hydrolase N-terminal domain-containing protein, partial [Candidatus Hinthialibacter sp.]
MIRFVFYPMMILLASAFAGFAELPPKVHNMVFQDLAERWDEAAPLGNGMLGALIWREDSVLRFSLDRADLWDNRPVDSFQQPEFRFDWIYQHVLKGDIQAPQNIVDEPYRREPAPTKIPAGRLEFDAADFGKVERVQLDIGQALCTVAWDQGVLLKTFIHAVEPVGWFMISGVTTALEPRIVPPPFGEPEEQTENVDSLNTHKLSALGYPAPQMEKGEKYTSYLQKGCGDFSFAIYCAWDYLDEQTIVGAWSIQSTEDERRPLLAAQNAVRRALK